VNIKYVRLLRRSMVVVPLTLAGVILIGLQFGGSGPTAPSSQLDSLSTSTKLLGTPAPTTVPHVAVNGHPVKIDAGGNADVTIPDTDGSVTHIVASGGHTTITSSSGSINPPVNSGKASSSNITVSSSSTNGNSWGTNQIYGFNNSSTANGSSSSSSTTQVFSTGSSNLDITSP
jgi:hypothetical protein